MGEEESLPSLSSASADRALEQAMVALKKGAHLLKYGLRRGKPKFCPFKLSMDEKFLIWYSGQEEKKLRLSTVTNIIQGLLHNTTKQLELDKESQCLSLIYANGKCSLQLICKDKVQAESWFMGLRAIISRNKSNGVTADTLKKQRGAQSCINSPAAFMRRKHILGLSECKTTYSEVQSLSGSPPSSFSCSSDSFYSASTRSNTSLINKDASSRILKDVYVWGEGNALQPKLVESTMMLDVRTLSLGRRHMALVTEHGEVFCWGEAKRGRLDHKLDIHSLCPKLVDSLTGIQVKHITCGEYQTCALTISGECYAWGDDDSRWLPRRLSGSLDGVTITNVACGEWHTAIVSECGRLFTYGDGTFGALGHGNLQRYSHPKQVESVKGLRVQTVACGPWHTAAVIVECGNRGGKLFTWGDSDKGRLGHHDQERKLVATCVSDLFDHDFVQVSCGDTLTAALTASGRVYTIGSVLHGPHGASIEVVTLDEFVVQVSSGCFHIAVLTSSGNVYTWGKGENGQLGLGDAKDRNSPCLVEALKGRKVEKVECGSSSTAAICAHKSLTSGDQLSCRGCGNVFGFTRKKHNCYNCGRLFCRSCCSKRSTSASLAPNETKPFRVCNGCFDQLQNASNVGGSTPRTSCITSKCSYDGDPSSEGKLDFNIQGQKTGVQDFILVEKGLPRWGSVSCPQIFTSNFRDMMEGENHVSGSYELSSQLLLDSRGGSNELEIYLSKEILKLKAQVHSLEELCRMRNEKIQENQQKIEEARSLAKEEASKCKEANELVQALTSKLCEMSEKISSRREAGSRLPQTRIHPVLSVNCKPTKVEDSNVDNLCTSSIVFSGKLRSTCNGDLRSGIGRPDSTKTATNVDRIQEYQPGVFITFTALSHGKTGLKRVRFSRKIFNESEAKRWWEENQEQLYRKCGIDDAHSIANR
ncbi:hypothetical protein ACS0TY_029661 [Phlomoides rotata]